MQSLHALFETTFLQEYSAASPKVRRQILPYLQALYRRWYYSTLVEGIQLTPANLSDTIAFHCGISPGTHIFPLATPPVSRLDNLAMRHITYSAHSHPVVSDYHTLINHCRPHIDLSEEWILTDKQATAVAKKLSLPDPYYASFLFELANRMGVLVRTPSLYVQRMQVATSKEATDILNLPHENLFRCIVDTTISLASAGLQNTMPGPVPFFTEDGLRGLLTDPLTTDEILELTFNSLGYDVADIAAAAMLTTFDIFSDEVSDIAEMMSGIYVLGIMLDRLFFTPFGHFLRIIRPFYSTKADIITEFKRFCTSNHEDYQHPEEFIIGLRGSYSDDDFSAFFAPCSAFKLTDLGLWFTGADATENNYLDFSQLLPETALNFAFATKENVEVFIDAASATVPISQLPNSIYSFRIKYLDDPSIWVTLQVPKCFSLHQLYIEITDAFFILEGDYDFYRGTFVNPFARYSGSWDMSNFAKKRCKLPDANPATVALRDLDFNHIRELLLVVTTYDGKRNFLLEWLNETAPDPKITYPDYVATSPAFDNILMDSDWDDDDDDDFDDY